MLTSSLYSPLNSPVLSSVPVFLSSSSHHTPFLSNSLYFGFIGLIYQGVKIPFHCLSNFWMFHLHFPWFYFFGLITLMFSSILFLPLLVLMLADCPLFNWLQHFFWAGRVKKAFCLYSNWQFVAVTLWTKIPVWTPGFMRWDKPILCPCKCNKSLYKYICVHHKTVPAIYFNN